MTQIYMPDDQSDPYIYLMDSVSLSGCPLTDAEVTAEQYLQFVARDLEDASERGAVNCHHRTRSRLVGQQGYAKPLPPPVGEALSGMMQKMATRRLR